jgi:putative transposase
MARLPRLGMSGYPRHVIQRRNNRQAIFLGDVDRERMLVLLLEHSPKNQVAIWP